MQHDLVQLLSCSPSRATFAAGVCLAALQSGAILDKPCSWSSIIPSSVHPMFPELPGESRPVAEQNSFMPNGNGLLPSSEQRSVCCIDAAIDSLMYIDIAATSASKND